MKNNTTVRVNAKTLSLAYDAIAKIDHNDKAPKMLPGPFRSFQLLDGGLSLANEPETMAAALRYADEFGWYVFPANLEGGEKKSYKSAEFSGGANWGMTKDAAQIRRDFKKWLLAGVGVPTGRVNNLIDIEADTMQGHGVDGIATLAKLEAELGPLPDTAMFESPSGSPHRLYNYPDIGPEVRIKTVPGTLGIGVDVKADGGMMIAPPSARGDGVYRWLNELPIADLPEVWVKRILELNGEARTRANGSDGEVSPFKTFSDERKLAPLDKIERALAALPTDSEIGSGREFYVKIGHAVKSGTGGSVQGLALFAQWRRGAPDYYDAQTVIKKWLSFHPGRVEPEITIATLFHLAGQADSNWDQVTDAKQQEDVKQEPLQKNEENEKLIFEKLISTHTVYGSDEWVAIGKALQSLNWKMGDKDWGLEVWDEWSKDNVKGYTNTDDLTARWNAFGDHDVTINKLFKIDEKKTEVKGPRFKLIPFDEMIPGKDRNYSVKGLLPRAGLVVVWGPPKCFKSFWTMDLVMHVALGREYRGRKVQQGTVVYCAFEGAGGFGARSEGLRRQYHLAGKPVPFFLIDVRMNLVADYEDLIESIEAQTEAPAIVVLDTLNRSLEGSESSDKDMGNYLNAAGAIYERFGCLVVIIHHCGIEGSRPRGHTSLSGTVDAQLKVTREESTATAEVEWMKDGPEGDIVESNVECIVVGKNVDGDDITTMIVKPSRTVVTPIETKLDGSTKTAFRLLKDAIAEAGVVMSGRHFPNHTPVVEVETWRSYCYGGGISPEGTKETKKKAFKRAVTRLHDHHRLIQLWEADGKKYVWIV